LGWRGYVLPRLLDRWPTFYSGLLIGVLWGSLHLSLTLPGMVYAGSTWLGTLLELIGLSVIITWFYVQTGGNVLITTLFHTMQSFFVILNDGITADQQLILMAVVYIAVSVILAFVYGPHLLRNPMKGQPAVVGGR
jgi:membrane protease YdiL (CAAX protease family)